MTFNRKLNLFSSMAYGMVFKKKSPALKDVQGSRGVRTMRQTAMVTGMDKYSFEQFLGSPHVRYYKVSVSNDEELFFSPHSCLLVLVVFISGRVVRYSPTHAVEASRERLSCVFGWMGLCQRG